MAEQHPGNEWIVVYESADRQSCSDRSLVLFSLGIPSELAGDGYVCTLIVPADVAERAKYELYLYEQENRPARPAAPRIAVVYQNGIPGAICYLLIIGLFAWVSANAAFGLDWLGAGRVDGELIRQGEWWRTITALTLHSGLRHLLGNAGFGLLFGILAGRLAGPGVAWLTIVIASGFANAINTILLESTHRSIGASTAVFAALGLVAGYVWRGKLMSQERWPYRVGPVVGGIALLAFTGTGDANTDIGAHLMGFVCGFLSGIFLTGLTRLLPNRRLQIVCGLSAIGIVLSAWMVAFHG